MVKCRVCNHEIQSGYSFCHFCGTRTGSDLQEGSRGLSATGLVEIVDKFKNLTSVAQDFASSTQGTANQLLGSPVSIQRQLVYALLSGFAIACISPPTTSFFSWFEGLLLISALLLLPVSFWTTGVMPFSSLVNQLLGPELSMRRRIIFSTLLSLPLAPSLSSVVASRTSQAPTDVISTNIALIGGVIFYPLSFLGTFLIVYYLLGFATSWRAINGCEFAISTKGLGESASSIADEICQSMITLKIPNLELTRVEMAKLRHISAGASSGTTGEQLSFIRGKARMVVFVQDFGNSLFIRAAGFYDGSGRRLWLLIGQWVAGFDKLVQRWIGSSPLLYLSQWAENISPATRNQLLLRPNRGGTIYKALRLNVGVSEYSWNELFALAGTVRDCVSTALESTASEKKDVDRIRSQIDRQARFERMASGSHGQSGV